MKQAWPALAGVAVVVGVLSVRPGAFTPWLWLVAIGLFLVAGVTARRRLLAGARQDRTPDGPHGAALARPALWFAVGGATAAIGALLALLTAPGGS